MRSFLKNLFHNIHSASKAGAVKPSTRRVKLQMEGLEDRTVPTAVNFSSGTLTISGVAQGHTITIESVSGSSLGIEVMDNGTAVRNYNPVNKESVSTVVIDLEGNNEVIVNDSNGMPFALNTTVAMNKSTGSNNTLDLEGNRVVAGSEQYNTGTPSANGQLIADTIAFNLDNSIPNVIDTIPLSIGAQFHVLTADFSVNLENGKVSGQETLEDLNPDGGIAHVVTFSGKPTVIVEQSAAPGAAVNLDATQSETTEVSFQVEMDNPGDSLNIRATPAGVSSIIGTAYSSDAFVNVATNLSQVYIGGNSTTSVVIGQENFSTGKDSTREILADISVSGVGSLTVNDSANKLSSSDIKLTNDEISGIGLFGNNAVQIGFFDVSTTPKIDS